MLGFLAPLAKIGFGAGAKAAAGGAAKAAAGGLAKKGLLTNAKRFAGDAMTSYLGGAPNAQNLAANFGIDAAFGVMAGLQDPGDIGDKLIRGLTVGGSGALGGIGGTMGLAKLTGKMPTGFARQATELGGAMLGDQIGYSMGDGLQRIKGGGMTAYEKQAMQQDALYKQQLEKELMAKYGINPIPSYNTNDPFLASNGIG